MKEIIIKNKKKNYVYDVSDGLYELTVDKIDILKENFNSPKFKINNHNW